MKYNQQNLWVRFYKILFSGQIYYVVCKRNYLTLMTGHTEFSLSQLLHFKKTFSDIISYYKRLAINSDF